MRRSVIAGMGWLAAMSVSAPVFAQAYVPVDARGGGVMVRAVHLADGSVVYQPVDGAEPASPPPSTPAPVAASAASEQPVAVEPVHAVHANLTPPERATARPARFAADATLAPAPSFVEAAADRPGTGATNFEASEIPAPPVEGVQVRVSSGAAAVDVFTLKNRPALIIDPRLGGAYDLDYTYTGPGLVRMNSGRYAFDVRPQWGFGVSSFNGSSSHAGAVVRFGRDLTDDMLDAFGVTHAKDVRNAQRWFLYAGASGRFLGWNVLPGQDGRRDLSYEENRSYVGTAQAGLAWRKGDLTASVGYVHDKARLRLFGARTETDDRVGLFVTYRPEPPKPRLALDQAPASH
jgi:Uncharacterized protein conserved in bacteria (DUF2219)